MAAGRAPAAVTAHEASAGAGPAPPWIAAGLFPSPATASKLSLSITRLSRVI
jgi:hypothetical protein